jgi:hypothetical protein
VVEVLGTNLSRSPIASRIDIVGKAISGRSVRSIHHRRTVAKMGDDSNVRSKQEEIDKNLAFFLRELPRIPAVYMGKFALIRHEEIISYYDTVADAINSADKIYPDGIFSIQQVTNDAVNLGFYSYAVPLATA